MTEADGSGTRTRQWPIWKIVLLAIIGLLMIPCVLIGAVVAFLAWSEVTSPKPDFAAIESAGAPAIAAIDRYIEREGHPPKDLCALLPDYDAQAAGTGFSKQEEFGYFTWPVGRTRREDPWELVVWTQQWSIDSDVYAFDSKKRAWWFTDVH